MQHREIEALREKEHLLESKIRESHQNQIDKDLTNILNLKDALTCNRQDHAQRMKASISNIVDNINHVIGLDDLNYVDDVLSQQKRHILDHESELQNLNDKHSQSIGHNLAHRLDVDGNRRNRSDFETENKNLNDAKVN